MRTLICLLLCIFLFSCNESNQNTGDTHMNSTPVSTDSLMRKFTEGWNKHDSAAIVNSIADYAIVFNDSLLHTGIDAIAHRWVSGGVKVLGNIKTQSALNNTNGNLAWDAGTYTLDITLPHVVLKEKGNYSIAWEKQSSEWKVVMVHIEDVSQMPDVK